MDVTRCAATQLTQRTQSFLLLLLPRDRKHAAHEINGHLTNESAGGTAADETRERRLSSLYGYVCQCVSISTRESKWDKVVSDAMEKQGKRKEEKEKERDIYSSSDEKGTTA